MFQKLKNWLSAASPEPASPQPSDSSAHRAERLTRLVEALQTNDANRRLLAAQELGELGEAAAEAIPHLALAAAAAKPEVRKAALEALPKIDPAWAAHPGVGDWAAGELVKKLDSSSPETARAAADVLAKIGKPAVPALVNSLENASAETHPDWQVKVLRKIGADAAAAAPALQRLFGRSENFLVKEAVLLAFSKMNLPLEPLQTTLLQGMEDSHSVVRLAAADVLAASGEAAAAAFAVPALVRTLADSQENIRLRARQTLVAIGSPAAPSLVKILENRESVRARHREREDKVLSQFLGNLQAAEWYRWRADFENSLGHYFDQAFEETARSQAAHEAALLALQKMELDEAFWNESLPVLLDLLSDKTQRLRELAVQLLGKAKGRLEDTSAALAELLDRPYDGALSGFAWRALLEVNGGELPDLAMEKLPVFLKVQEDETLRSEVLKLLAGKGRSAVPFLLQTLGVGGDWNLRALVCLTLGDMAGEAAEAAPELRRLAAADPHGRVQAAAKAAAERVENGVKSW